MLQYEKMDVSEGIDVNKTNLSKECELCHYWFFKNVEFKFEEHFLIDIMIINDGTWIRKYNNFKRKRSYFNIHFVGH